ncbi:MAG: hypothetical protein RLY31_942 [Bacteroidota bacterium]
MKPEQQDMNAVNDAKAPPLRGLRILFVLENYFPNIGGVEKLFRQLAEALGQRGVRVTVVTNRLDAGQPFRERQGNITILRYRFRNRYLFGFLAFFPAFKHAKHCNLVHTTSFNAAMPAFLAAFLRKKPVIVTFHEAWGKLWFRLAGMHPILQALHFVYEWLLLRLPFDRFVAVSEFTRESLLLKGVSARRIRRIYNGITYPSFPPERKPGKAAHRSLRCLYFGRIGISKGIYLLLEAASSFRETHPDARFTLVVPQEPAVEYRRLHARISEWALDTCVEVRSGLSDEELNAAIRSADAVVIPSQSEGFCFAAVETAALGTPILSSGCGALPEVVSGSYIHMEDYTVAAMVRALEKAAADKWETSPLRRFELQETIAQYLTLYKTLVGGSDEKKVSAGLSNRC